MILRFVAFVGIFFLLGFTLTYGITFLVNKKKAYYKLLLYTPCQRGIIMALILCMCLLILCGVLPLEIQISEKYFIPTTLKEFMTANKIFSKVIHIIMDIAGAVAGVVYANKLQYIIEFADKFWLDKHYGIK